MKIVVLGGGISTERNVSLASSNAVCRALRSLGHKAIFVDMYLGLENYEGMLEAAFDEPDGFCAELGVSEQEPDLAAVKASRKLQSPSRLGKGVLELCAMADFVFLGLHGEDGEDGRIQAALDLLGVPYNGSGAVGSAMAMDKAISKRTMEGAGVLTAKWEEITYTEADVPGLVERLELPCVVKAVNGGSSIGVSLPKTKEALEEALRKTLQYSNRIIVEEKIVGREVTLPILGDQYLDAIEIVPPESGEFDYIAKYQGGTKAATEICPARITPEEHKMIGEAAFKLHRALGLKVYSRTDFIIDAQGRPWCLEVNTLPGMTGSSLFPKAARQAGLCYEDLCAEIVRLSLAK